MATNTSTGWPAPFGNWYTTARQQYLIYSGRITGIWFRWWENNRNAHGKLLARNGGTATAYQNYTITMGCTSHNSH